MTVATGSQRSAVVDDATIDAVAEAMLAEDLALGPDVTTETCVQAGTRCTAVLRARTAGVIAGLEFSRRVLRRLAGDDFHWEAAIADGARVSARTAFCSIESEISPLLTAERSMLNLLTHLSGIATLTATWVDAVAGTGAQIRDTRKTLPGLRVLEKYAVRCGGGVNHRMALGDAALIKDNHIIGAGGVAEAVAAVRRRSADIELEVECDNLAQVAEALQAGATLILLDNMSIADMTEAVEAAKRFNAVKLEASGGLTLANAREVAQTGVDYLAVGALTHSAPALDIGLDIDDNG